MMIYYSDSFEVKYDHQQGILMLSCSRRLQSEHFKEGVVRALRFAAASDVKRWLLDTREIGCLNEEEESWLQSCLFPQMMSSLGTDNYIAVVLSERCYKALLLKAGKVGLKSYNSFIILNTFYELKEARAWLKNETLAVTNE